MERKALQDPTRGPRDKPIVKGKPKIDSGITNLSRIVVKAPICPSPHIPLDRVSSRCFTTIPLAFRRVSLLRKPASGIDRIADTNHK